MDTDVSDEHTVSIFRVDALKVEASGSSETLENSYMTKRDEKTQKQVDQVLIDTRQLSIQPFLL